MDQCSPLSFHRFGSQVKVIHFLGQVKPWYCSYNASTGQLNSPSGNQIANDFIRQWWISYTANVHPKIETVSWHLLNLTSTLSLPILQLNIVGSLSNMRISPPPPSSSYGGGEAGGGNSSQPSTTGRFDAWQQGQADYLGADSFDNIQRKLDEAIKP